jgi:aspartyl-tRNA(Asn)/glutamyl-tRNA(Gln) amidotransferase subunit B
MKGQGSSKYEAVIGLEIHAQLSTSSKIYCSDSAEFGGAPNTHISVVSLAHPGTLPRLNKKVIELAIKMGLACRSEISRTQIFDRKNYFYPDLPKGYQLTQDRTPICKRGLVPITTKDGVTREIKLNRIHIEEDAGKSMHVEGETDTLVDFNRAGVPLIEIVTEPDIHSSTEAGALLSEVRKIVRYLDICDGNMEEGSLRCDANVSVRVVGETKLGSKVEIKNMNSIRNVQRAIDAEIERQISVLESGEKVVSETRMFNQGNGKTYAMRTKEQLNDYRYFPDPDLSPLEVSNEWLTSIQRSMPELPQQKQQRWVSRFGIPEYDAAVLAETRELAGFFEELCSATSNFKAASNWVMGPVKSYLNERSIEADKFPISSAVLGELISLVDAGRLSYTVAAQKIFPVLLSGDTRSPLRIAEELNLIQESNEGAIQPIIKQVIREFPLKVEEYKKGKKGIVAMFMGEVMKRSKGKADPKLANELLMKTLEEL